MSRAGVDATGPGRRARALGVVLPALAVALVLVGCGSSGKGLIPSANATPLVGDFENVLEAAESGGGNCSATEAALTKTEEDFRSLPSTIDAGLRANLRQGIANLSDRAHELCLKTTTTATHTTTTTTTQKTPTTPKPTTTTTTTAPPTTTTTPPATTTTPPGSGGGTPAPGETPSGAGEGGEEHPAGGEGSPGGAGAPEGQK